MRIDEYTQVKGLFMGTIVPNSETFYTIYSLTNQTQVSGEFAITFTTEHLDAAIGSYVNIQLLFNNSMQNFIRFIADMVVLGDGTRLIEITTYGYNHITGYTIQSGYLSLGDFVTAYIFWNSATRKYNLTLFDDNNAQIYSCISNFSFPYKYSSKIVIEKQYLKVIVPDLSFFFIYKIDFSMALNYYPFRIFDIGIIERLGFFGLLRVQIPLLLLENANIQYYRELYANITISFVDISKLVWIEYILENQTQFTVIVFQKVIAIAENLDSIDLLVHSFSELNYNSYILNVTVSVEIIHTLKPESLFDIYLNSLIPISILLGISFMSFFTMRKNKVFFWLVAFITNICLMLYYNLFDTMGGILSVAILFFLIFTKFKEED